MGSDLRRVPRGGTGLCPVLWAELCPLKNSYAKVKLCPSKFMCSSPNP